MTQTCLDFDWKVLEVESELSLSQALRQAGESDLFLVGEPRPINFLTRAELAKRRVTFVDLKAMKRIIDYEVADQVIGIESGITLKDLDAILIENNQWLPLNRASSTISLSEAITAGDGGYLEHAFGGPRDLVLGLRVMLSTGVVINTGGKVVKNVTGYDLTKLFVGGRGALGLTIAANLRLFARPESACSLAAISARPSELIDLSSRIVRSGLPIVALELISVSAFNRENGELKILRSSLKSEIEEKLGGSVKHDSALLVQVAGNQRVVTEVSPLVRSLMESSGASVFEQSHIPEDPSLIQLFDPCPGESFIEVAASMSQMRDMLIRLENQDVSVPFTARPSACRLRFLSDGNPILDSLVSGRDEGRELSIERRLKERFDPSGRFPPVEVSCFG